MKRAGRDALPEGQEKTLAVRSMFDAIAPRYELVNRILTFGLDGRWRRNALQLLELIPGATVLDVACGTGDFCRLLRASGHRAIGIDLALGMLDNAHTDAPLVQADVSHLPFANESFDGLTCGFALRNFVDLPSFFSEAARVVRAGGRIGLLDAYEPSSRPLRIGHKVYFGNIVPLVGGLLSGNRAAYGYLPRSVEYMPTPEVVLKQIEDAGFVDVERHVFLGGSAHLFTATRSGSD